MFKQLYLGLGFDSDEDPFPMYVSIPTLMPKHHDYLFAFLDKIKDLIKLSGEVTDYVYGEPDRKKAAGIVEGIKEIHPFFKYGNFASDLLNTTMAEELVSNPEPGEPYEEEFSSHVYTGTSYQSKNIHDYLKSDEEYNETLDTLLPLCWDLKKRITLILDDSNPEMKALEPEQRNSLYSFVCPHSPVRNELEIVHMPMTLSLPVSSGMRTFGAAMDFDDKLMSSYVHAVNDMILKPGKTLPDVIKSAVAYADGKKENAVTTYDIRTLKDLLNLEVFFMISDGTRVMRCANCGKLFPVVEKGQTCCTFTAVNGESCRDLELKRNKKLDVKKQLTRLRTRAYKTHFARVKSGKETDEDMEKWKAYATKLREKVLNGEMTIAEYEKDITEVRG